MDPREQFCHNRDCWAYGRQGEGHIAIHSRRERRYRCERCGRTFAATKGTALYRAHKPAEVAVQVVTLLAHGCPAQAIVAAFGWDERTVARYQAEAGAQCRAGRPRLVLPGGVMIAQVVKRYAKRCVVGVAHRVVRGTADAVQARLAATQGRTTAVINTAYVERLNATLRAHLAALVRRTRAAARQTATVEAGLWLVGT